MQALGAQPAAGAFADAGVEVCESVAPGLALTDVAGVARRARLGQLGGTADAILDWASRMTHRIRRAKK